MEKELSVEDMLKKSEKLSESGEYEEALMCLDKLDTEGEQGALICFVRGNVYARREQWESAQKWYAESMKKGYISDKLFMNWANLKVQLNQAYEAIELYRQAFELKPTDITPLNSIVQIRLETGNIEGALTTMGQMMDTFPELYDGFHHYADYLLGTGKSEEAMAFLEKYEQRFSANMLYIYDKAKAMSAVDKTKEALEYLYGNKEKFVNSPMLVMFKKECGRLLFKLGEYEEAVPFLLELFDNYRDREAGLNLIAISFVKEEYELAYEIADRITQYPGRGRGHFLAAYYKGAAMQLAGNKEKSGEAFQIFLQELYEVPEEEVSMELLGYRFRAEYVLGKDEEMQKTLDIFEVRFAAAETNGESAEDIEKAKQSIEDLRKQVQEKANSFC